MSIAAALRHEHVGFARIRVANGGFCFMFFTTQFATVIWAERDFGSLLAAYSILAIPFLIQTLESRTAVPFDAYGTSRFKDFVLWFSFGLCGCIFPSDCCLGQRALGHGFGAVVNGTQTDVIGMDSSGGVATGESVDLELNIVSTNAIIYIIIDFIFVSA